MKCVDCLNLLAEYIDGEVIEHDAERINAHLTTCAACANELQTLSAEMEIFARYDRELNVSPAMWNAIQARTAAESQPVGTSSKFTPRAWLAGLFAAPRFGFAASGAMAVVIIAAIVGAMYLRTQPQPGIQPQPGLREKLAGGGNPIVPPGNKPGYVAPLPVSGVVTRRNAPEEVGRARKPDDPGVLFANVAYSDLAESDTAEHIRQAENLLRSIRSLQASDDESEIDVSFEKAMSRRLLSENEVLRRDAETAGKFPTKELLGDLEPLLIDIANLPDKATPDKLRAIKERVQKTEIVAALVSY